MPAESSPQVSRSAHWLIISLASLVLIFLTDLLTPLGFAHGSLYILSILLVLLTRNERLILLTTAAVIILIGLGFFLSPEGFSLTYVLLNRLVSCLGILGVTVISILMLRHMHRTQMLVSELQESRSLLHQQERFRQIADYVPQVLWTTTPEGELDFINHAIEEYSHRSTDSLLGSNWLELIHEEDVQGCLDAWSAALASGEVYQYQFRVRRHDGVYRWFHTEARPVRDSDDTVVLWCGLLIDIHDHKRLEDEALQQSERLHNTLEQITDAFFMLDTEWRFSYVNHAAEKLLDRNRETILGQVIWDEFPGTSRIRHFYEEAATTHETVCFQETFQPTGRYFDVRLFPIRDQGIAVYFRDVTRESLQQEEMREARERFENVARATTDAIWDWNLLTDEVWWNDSIETLFGYSRDELEQDSRSWTSRIHPEDREVILSEIHQALNSDQQEWQSDYRFRRKDGSYAYVSDSGFIIRDENGKAVRAVGGMSDITEKRLMAERMGQSQRLEAIGQLTGGVAHDFNNLLTVIQGNTELLQEDLVGDEEKLSLLRMTQDAAGRASELTRHLLAFARRQPLEPDSIDIKRLLNDMEPLLRRTLMENIHIELVHGGGLWPALVDAAQLENAILNLCLNARDAMPTGGRLTIETSNAHLDQHYADQHIDVQPGQYVLVAVSDTGSGIPASMVNSVFDPFFTTKEADKGTGLGLSMVYGFVKQSQGHIKVYSEEGQGTTVRIYLPKAPGDATVSIRKTDTRLQGGEGKILLVEDDELVRIYAEHLLRDLGYTVLAAGEAREALALLDANDDICLLFTDIIMPGSMNGRQLADEARQRRPDLKVLFTSGYTENAIVHQGRLDPGVELISKPYLRKDLANKIRAILNSDQ